MHVWRHRQRDVEVMASNVTMFPKQQAVTLINHHFSHILAGSSSDVFSVQRTWNLYPAQQKTDGMNVVLQQRCWWSVLNIIMPEDVKWCHDYFCLSPIRSRKKT